VIEFMASGSPRIVSRAIEEYAAADGHVTAIVVPWESHGTTLSMAVTSVKSDGWAIEHTNLGTITLTDRGDDRTGVTISPEQADRRVSDQLLIVFDRFARQIHAKFAVAR
jgi:hypothetical protein